MRKAEGVLTGLVWADDVQENYFEHLVLNVWCCVALHRGLRCGGGFSVCDVHVFFVSIPHVTKVTSWVAHRIAALPDEQRLLFEKELLSCEKLKLFPSNTTSGERVISPAKFTSLMQYVGAEWSNEQTDSLLSAAGMQDKEQVPLEDLFKWVFVSPVL